MGARLQAQLKILKSSCSRLGAQGKPKPRRFWTRVGFFCLMAVCPVAHCVPGLLHAHCPLCPTYIWTVCPLCATYLGAQVLWLSCCALYLRWAPRGNRTPERSLGGFFCCLEFEEFEPHCEEHICRTVFRLERKSMHMSPALTTIV